MMDDMEALGREYKIDTWEPFRETDLIALDAASVSISLSYGKPWSWVKWDMRMGPHHEFTRPQSEYYRKIYKQLLEKRHDKSGSQFLGNRLFSLEPLIGFEPTTLSLRIIVCVLSTKDLIYNNSNNHK